MLDFFQRSEFTKNVFILVSGSSIAQMIPLLAEPVVSRIFKPEEFGVYEIYIAIVMMLGVIATARYEMATVLPRTENKAINVLGLSLVFVTIFSFLILLLIFFWKEWILSLIPAEGFGKYLYYVPLGIFLLGLNRSFLYWMIRRKQMKSISAARISESSTKAGSSIFFGVLNFSSMGLIWGQIVGQFFSVVIMIWQFFSRDRNKTLFLSCKSMRQLSKKYIEFPMVNVPIALSETLQVSGIIFIFSFYFDNASVGEFSKALRILLIPLYLVGSSIAQVFYQKASKDYNNGIDISKSLRQIVVNLLKWSVLPLVVFIFISPWLFGFVLGQQWVAAGEYARILSIWIFVKFVTSPIAMIPLIIDKQKIYLLLNLIGNIIMIASVLIPGVTGLSITTTLLLLSFSQAVFMILLYFKVLSIYKGIRPGSLSA